MNAFVHGSQESIIRCRKIAREYLGDHVDSVKVYDSDKTPIVYGVGHCHIGKVGIIETRTQLLTFVRHVLAVAVGGNQT